MSPVTEFYREPPSKMRSLALKSKQWRGDNLSEKKEATLCSKVLSQVFDRENYIPKGSLKYQAYENYFYGEEGEIEEALSQIEGATCPSTFGSVFRVGSGVTVPPFLFTFQNFFRNLFLPSPGGFLYIL